MMERVARSGRQLLPPQAVDEPVDVDHPALPEREHRQQGLTLRAAHVCGRPVRESLERAAEAGSSKAPVKPRASGAPPGIG